MHTRLLRGRRGAVSAAHPLAVAAGLAILERGGTAVDAAVAAQAVLAVTMPGACGVGGDALMLVAAPLGTSEGAEVIAVNGTGPVARAQRAPADDGGAAVTVPGAVGAWHEALARFGRLPLAAVLRPAIDLARAGVPVTASLAAAVQAQRHRLLRGGAGEWALLSVAAGGRLVQPALASLLAGLGAAGPSSFYAGEVAAAVAAAVRRDGGVLDEVDLAAPATTVHLPISTAWSGGRVHVQPPTSQGVLLAMALQWLDRAGEPADGDLDHVCVELTEAVFGFRDSVAVRGADLLEEPLAVDLARAARRGGPRGYLHTAGVATADRDGLVVSSLVSVFDDFGSGTFVPAGGFVLNNRGGGFTSGDNAFRPGGRPVHTLAPALVETPAGPVALATPGADGQIQTLLQVLATSRRTGGDWAGAVAAPRWRSEGGRLLLERSHPAQARLLATGHDIDVVADGDARFGAVVCAGLLDGEPFALADTRREVTCGVV